MSVTVVYRNGVFVPLEPVQLPEESRFEIEVAKAEVPPPGGQQWGFGKVLWIAEDFDQTPAEFEDHI